MYIFSSFFSSVNVYKVIEIYFSLAIYIQKKSAPIEQASFFTKGHWRNGSAFDSRSKGYPFESGMPHSVRNNAIYFFGKLLKNKNIVC